MQMIEANIHERGLLPLPAAAMIVDIRGVSDDAVIERLSIETADLASEMKNHKVYHWRHLTELLSFRRIGLTADVHTGQISSNDGQPALGDQQAQHGPTGLVHPLEHAMNFLLPSHVQNTGPTGNSPFDPVQQQIDEMVVEISRIRNNRIAAVRDLNIAGIPGRSFDDATVRVIFLADAESLESLSSAALYADRLKEYYQKLEHAHLPPLINTTILCLGRSGEVGPPEKLIKGLRRNDSWKHVDSLILSEDYREDAALIAGTIQAYLAELLLYVLLIIPPLPAPQQNGSPAPTVYNTTQANGQVTHKEISLPPNTFVLGLAALEYSARWGRRWLNFGLARVVADVLRQKPADENKEKTRIKGIADTWFKNWRIRVQATIPDNPPGDVPALEGIRRAREAAAASLHFPPSGTFSFNMGKRTIQALQGYLSGLTQTYIAPTSEPDLRVAVLQSTPQIMQVLQKREAKSTAERKVNELGVLQVEAEQILSHPQFLGTVVGSFPRARTQLWALGATISSFQQDHQNNPMNPLSARDEIQHKCKELEQAGSTLIDHLNEHIERWPLFARALPFKSTMAVLTLLLIMFLSLVTVLVGFAWLHHLIFLRLASALPIVDAGLLGVPTLEVVAWGMIVLVLLIELLILGPGLINKRRTPLQVEIVFWSALLAFALYGLLVNFSLTSLGNLLDDTISIQYVGWLSFIPQWSLFALMAAIFILIAEIAYTIWWFSHLQRERDRIVNELRTQHESNISDVTNFIADDVTSEILQRAELTDGKGGLGGYYYRVAQLCDVLDEVAVGALHQQQLAANRLLLSQNEGSGSASSGSVWLSLHIRDEKLEMDVLTEEYKSLKEKLVEGNEDLKELAEFLLRMAGSEKPAEIGQQFEDRPSNGNDEQRLLKLYMTALVGIATRFTVEPLKGNIDTITKQYKSTHEYARQQMPALNTLIQTLKGTATQVTLQVSGQTATNQQAMMNMSPLHSDIVAEAFALWGQLLWQNINQRLDQALMQGGVLAQLARLHQRDYDPRAIMRHLLARTSIFGRSPRKNRLVNVYLLLAPSQQSHDFRQGLKNLRLPGIIEFPDIERILLIGVQHYIAEPMQLPDPQADVTAQAPNTPDPNAVTLQSGQQAQVAGNAIGTGPATLSGAGSTPGPNASTSQPTSVAPPAQQTQAGETATGTSTDTSTDSPTVPQQRPVSLDLKQQERVFRSFQTFQQGTALTQIDDKTRLAQIDASRGIVQHLQAGVLQPLQLQEAMLEYLRIREHEKVLHLPPTPIPPALQPHFTNLSHSGLQEVVNQLCFPPPSTTPDATEVSSQHPQVPIETSTTSAQTPDVINLQVDGSPLANASTSQPTNVAQPAQQSQLGGTSASS